MAMVHKGGVLGWPVRTGQIVANLCKVRVSRLELVVWVEEDFL